MIFENETWFFSSVSFRKGSKSARFLCLIWVIFLSEGERSPKDARTTGAAAGDGGAKAGHGQIHPGTRGTEARRLKRDSHRKNAILMEIWLVVWSYYFPFHI